MTSRDWILRELKRANKPEIVKDRGYICCTSAISTYSIEIADLFADKFERPIGAYVGGLMNGASLISLGLYNAFIDVDGDSSYWPFYVRKVEKGGRFIEPGVFDMAPPPVGLPVIIVDDVLGTGYSIVKAAKAVEKEWGYKPTLAVVLVDNEVGGKEFLKTKGIECKSIFTRKEILNA